MDEAQHGKAQHRKAQRDQPESPKTGRRGSAFLPCLRRLARMLRWGLAIIGLLVAAFTAWLIVAVWPAEAGSVRQNVASSFFRDLPAVLNIAHRGASKDAPEHTWAAYDLALSQGAHVLELDVRSTRDGLLVVSHDRSLKRTTGLELAVGASTYAHLQAAAGTRAPLLLTDVLAHYPHAHLNVELKDEAPAVAATLASVLQDAKAESRVLVASGRAGMLEAFREASGGRVATSAGPREAARCLTAYWLGRTCEGPFVALQLPSRRSVPSLGTVDFHRFLHEQGLVVHYFTVDQPEAQRALLSAGADGIMTNRPDRLARVLREMRPSAP